jgi:AbrB family looped-hinge helix DNA binding protein
MSVNFYKTRLRTKGQITVPQQIRSQLGAEEGDDLVFYTDENGHVVISRAQIVPPDQAWFWSERWQRMEHEAEQDIASGKVTEFPDVSSALNGLDAMAKQEHAKD